MNRRSLRRPKPRSRSFYRALYGVLATIILLAIYAIYPSQWDGEERMVIAADSKLGAQIIVVDPISEKIVTLMLPASTQVEVARDLGTWNIGSVWELGQNEGYSGALLGSTVVKTFNIPVDVWASEKVEELINGRLSSYFNAILGFETNIGIKDRIKLANFSFTLGAGDTIVLDLTKTTYLKKVDLAGGEVGHEALDRLPRNLRGLFVMPSVSKEAARVELVDGGSTASANNVARVSEVLGVKVASIEEDDLDIDCIVTGENATAERLSSIFECVHDNKTPYGGFDVSIRLGKQFAERF